MIFGGEAVSERMKPWRRKGRGCQEQLTSVPVCHSTLAAVRMLGVISGQSVLGIVMLFWDIDNCYKVQWSGSGWTPELHGERPFFWSYHSPGMGPRNLCDWKYKPRNDTEPVVLYKGDLRAMK